MKNFKSIFVIILILKTMLVYSQDNISSFENISIENGLSNNNITQIYQDNEGFIWIATQDGLNKYDGYYFKIYRNERNDSSSLSSSYIKSIFQDSKNRLWIGTRRGLNLYNKETDSFTRCIDFCVDKRLDKAPDIRSILEDPEGNLWMGTYNLGLLRYNPELKIFNHFYNCSSLPNHESHSQIIKPVLLDSIHLLVPLYANGIASFNIQTKQFKKIPINPKFKQITRLYKTNDSCFILIDRFEGMFHFKKTKDDFVAVDSDTDWNIQNIYFSDLCIDSRGNFWAGSAKGLYVKTSQGITIYENNASNPNSLRNNRISCIFADNNDGVWIGTENYGISYFTYHANKFKENIIDGFKFEDLFNVQVNDLHNDGNRNIWLATEDHGLYQITPDQLDIKEYSNSNLDFTLNSFTSVQVDSKNNTIWAGSKAGVFVFNAETHKVEKKPTDGSPEGSSSKVITFIYDDKMDDVWIGTNGGGLNHFNRSSNKFKHHQHDIHLETSISGNGITCMHVDRNGNYWLGTNGAGLNRLDKSSNTFQRICILCSDSNIYNDVTIFCIKQNHFPGLWIGTASGLVYYNPETENKINFTSKDGLPDNSINSIEIDEGDNLWIGTNKGLSKAVFSTGIDENSEFNGEMEFINYKRKDGIPSLVFLPNASTMFNGELLFGTLKGVVSVSPKHINDSEFQPNILITRLRIGDETVEINDTINKQVVLTKNISLLDKISLNHKNKNFSIEFASLDFSAPLHNKYKYKLEGFDDDWIMTYATTRSATYTNLDPGNYKLVIKGSNSDGVWSPITNELNIEIVPPWWLNGWAYMIYLVVILSLFTVYFSILTSRISLKKTLEFEKKSREKEEELSLFKNRFFTNVTHEFRTPLSLILGPANQLLEETANNPKLFSKVNSIKTNATRLLNLINELLSIRKIETGKEKLKIQEISIVAFSNELTLAFKESSLAQNITFTTHFPSEDLRLFIDPAKIEKVIYNLLSNAFKYCRTGGVVDLSIEPQWGFDGDDGSVSILIKDNGIGIKQEEQKNIFKRFYVQNEQGTTSMGIGLSLAKDYVEMHHGTIEVESSEGQGTSMTVTIPMGKSHFEQSEQVENGVYSMDEDTLRHNLYEEEKAPIAREKIEDQATLLVVEDNKELLQFISNTLQDNYNVEVATNGEQGIEMAKALIPDLIVSDIMMPVKDGIELCKELKHDMLTSHIPIILLTAKSFEEDKIDGYLHGADAYISKPFNFKHLNVRIENLLKQRNKLREIYIQQIEKEQIAIQKEDKPKIDIPLVEIEVKALDNQFMDELFDVINKNLTDPTLNIEKICNILGMSYNQLYRKVKALTNMSVKDLIMKARLKAAANLLLGGKVNVSEAGYLTGFNSPAYFSKTFKDYFGVTPTCYIEKNRTNDTLL